MDRIESFKINHIKLERGVYISRVDGDVVTYDIRMKKPNGGDYLENGELHTIEHLFATYVRNSNFSDKVIYFGPMGCRTGFYFLVRDAVSKTEALDIIIETFKFIADFSGVVPGCSEIECGNYLEHDLTGAKNEAKEMLEVLKEWNTEKMKYAE